MDRGYLWKAFVRVALSLLCAGLFYVGWLAVFLTTDAVHTPALQVILWPTAPVVTAAGYAVGIAAAERLARGSKTRFVRIFIWPLIGCAVGAGAVYWFGPMLIVFGMFAAGTISVLLREVILYLARLTDTLTR